MFHKDGSFGRYGGYPSSVGFLMLRALLAILCPFAVRLDSCDFAVTSESPTAFSYDHWLATQAHLHMVGQVTQTGCIRRIHSRYRLSVVIDAAIPRQVLLQDRGRLLRDIGAPIRVLLSQGRNLAVPLDRLFALVVLMLQAGGRLVGDAGFVGFTGTAAGCDCATPSSHELLRSRELVRHYVVRCFDDQGLSVGQEHLGRRCHTEGRWDTARDFTFRAQRRHLLRI